MAIGLNVTNKQGSQTKCSNNVSTSENQQNLDYPKFGQYITPKTKKKYFPSLLTSGIKPFDLIRIELIG